MADQHIAGSRKNYNCHLVYQKHYSQVHDTTQVLLPELEQAGTYIAKRSAKPKDADSSVHKHWKNHVSKTQDKQRSIYRFC